MTSALELADLRTGTDVRLPQDPIEGIALVDEATELLRQRMGALADVRARLVAGVVAREGSVRKAATVLGVSPNAVHRATKR